MGVKQGKRQEVTGEGSPGAQVGAQVKLSTGKAQRETVGGARAWEPTKSSCTFGQEAWLPDSWTGPAPRRAGTDPRAPVGANIRGLWEDRQPSRLSPHPWDLRTGPYVKQNHQY